ncbi:hypothetical protein NLG97_g4231 [Lecanicillium saksenae]|uniref:Uncharacterized protein n=1 Tax=Lecanicillium saksenae TaxID=468837 RepID=A0ACC1QYG9_9HYPO|nr:hypothetical protein NLG97_g4231 [Lecanicillium saksenae]
MLECHAMEQEPPKPGVDGSKPGGMSIDQPHSSRYLGQGSDTQFLNLAANSLGAFSPAEDTERENTESGGGDEVPAPRKPLPTWTRMMPSWDVVETYLDAYFTTVHIAYPFLPRSHFIRKFKDAQCGDCGGNQLTAAWYALFYGVLAIGALHDHLLPQPSSSPSNLHEQYFQQSIHLTDINRLEASAVQVSVLLLQCLYLLAVSRTDKCWITLGIAVRLAQALGLHMDFAGGTRSWSYLLPVSQRIEIRRRVWYSLYVMDRLLALQAGRPPAIADGGFGIPLPSNLDDNKHDWEIDTPFPSSNEPSLGVYFLHVIELSRLSGDVVQRLNEGIKTTNVRLAEARQLEAEFSAWKHKLPRYLRFDLVHVFDKSPHFKRQRNMLAIQYHHLRALLHRQWLRLPTPDPTHTQLWTETEPMEARRYGEICISEAHRTASLFHNLSDPSELIFGFPWWQLVDCVVCAASILIVALNLRRADESGTEGEELREDANACLEVLNAVCERSKGCQHARDTIASLLSRCSAATRTSAEEGQSDAPLLFQAQSAAQYSGTDIYATGEELPFNWMNNVDYSQDQSFIGHVFDPVLWSTQLLHSMGT